MLLELVAWDSAGLMPVGEYAVQSTGAGSEAALSAGLLGAVAGGSWEARLEGCAWKGLKECRM